MKLIINRQLISKLIGHKKTSQVGNKFDHIKLSSTKKYSEDNETRDWGFCLAKVNTAPVYIFPINPDLNENCKEMS